jgi:hypothetical protein
MARGKVMYSVFPPQGGGTLEVPEMDDLRDNLTSMSYWVCVVLATVLINIGTAYLKPVLDKWASHLSARRRLQSEAQEIAMAAKRDYLKANPSELVFVGLQEIRHLIRSLSAVLTCFAFMGCSALLAPYGTVISRVLSIFCLVLGLFYVVGAQSEWNEATRLKRLLGEARSSTF